MEKMMALKKKEQEEKAKKAAAMKSDTWEQGMPSNRNQNSHSLSKYDNDQLEDIINE